MLLKLRFTGENSLGTNALNLYIYFCNAESMWPRTTKKQVRFHVGFKNAFQIASKCRGYYSSDFGIEIQLFSNQKSMNSKTLIY